MARRVAMIVLLRLKISQILLSDLDVGNLVWCMAPAGRDSIDARPVLLFRPSGINGCSRRYENS